MPIIRTLAHLAFFLACLPAQANFHLWATGEIYSNADGTVQFIELDALAGGQQFLATHSITSSSGATTRTFPFPADLPGDTAGRKFLIGTSGFAALGVVTPDYVVPDGFLFIAGGTVNFVGVDIWNHGALPTDGSLSLLRSGATATNSPTNFAGATGQITPAAHTLTVVRNGTGTGTVSSSPAGIDCGATCTANFTFGSAVTLIATPAGGATFTGWSGACTGTGTCPVTMNAAVSVTATFTDPAAPNPPRLANISTRGRVQTGNDVMIGGFIIGGSTPKKVLITARGPSLTAFGVTGAMANPSLQLFSGQTVIAANDDWQTNANAAEISATGIAPTNAQEAALLVTLNPGAYTAIVSGVGGGTGVGIVEVFERDRPDLPLINISTRGQVQTGDNVMIGGFIIQGDAPMTVLVTARGPSLAAFGITNPLANPQLQLLSGQTVIASNDDWQTNANATAIQATGAAPTNSLESAILITLNPGAYTAIVSGVGGGAGVGIVEVFVQ